MQDYKNNSEIAPWDRPKTNVAVKIKTMYIVGMLLGLGVLGIVFAFFLLPKNNITNDLYAPCSALHQEKCISRNDCQAIFDAYAQFDSCAPLSVADIAERDAKKILCENSKGEWKFVKFGYFCDCSAQNKIYTNGIGCY